MTCASEKKSKSWKWEKSKKAWAQEKGRGGVGDGGRDWKQPQTLWCQTCPVLFLDCGCHSLTELLSWVLLIQHSLPTLSSCYRLPIPTSIPFSLHADVSLSITIPCTKVWRENQRSAEAVRTVPLVRLLCCLPWEHSEVQGKKLRARNNNSTPSDFW